MTARMTAVRRTASLSRVVNTYGSLFAIAILAMVLLVWAPSAMTPFRLGNLGKYRPRPSLLKV